MEPFVELRATAMPLRMENVDTDQIIPAKYLTAVTKEGMGDGLFSWLRYESDGAPRRILSSTSRSIGGAGSDRRPELRQRLQPRTRGLGADRLWL